MRGTGIVRAFFVLTLTFACLFFPDRAVHATNLHHGRTELGSVHGGIPHFESGPVHPLALSPSGDLLLALYAEDASVEVYRRVTGGLLEHTGSIPVGLEPVSVRWQNDDVAWVVNRLSGTVSLIDPKGWKVIRTLTVGPEPADVAFARGHAFVSLSGSDSIAVFDLDGLDRPPQRIPLAGRFPRTLAVSRDGETVHGVFLLSGNGTRVVSAKTIYSDDGGIVSSRLAALGAADPRCKGTVPPAPPLPPNVVRATEEPKVGRILRWDVERKDWLDAAGQSWAACSWPAPDEADLFTLDAQTLEVGYVGGVGTVLYDLAVNPADGSLWIPHTEALNHIRFEHRAGLQSHFVDQRVARYEPGSPAVAIDLNGQLEAVRNTKSLTPAEIRFAAAVSVAQPVGLAWEPTGRYGWIASMGTGEVVRIDGSCREARCILGPDRLLPVRIETGGLPIGLEVDRAGDRLYVLDEDAHAVLTVFIGGEPVADEAPKGQEPLERRARFEALPNAPSGAYRDGRRVLYDARSSSRFGDAACATCHVFGDRDGIAWDLGNPEGEFVSYDSQPALRFIRPEGNRSLPCRAAECAQELGFAAEKGPMATQTLREMQLPLHWRGDRADVSSFNRVFVELMGRPNLRPDGPTQGTSKTAMALLDGFLSELRQPSNPLRSFEGALPVGTTAVPGTAFQGSASVGERVFRSARSTAGRTCASCHFAANGSADGALANGRSVGAPAGDFKVATLGAVRSKHGIGGLGHEGAAENLGQFLASSEFDLTPQQSRDLAAFLVSFPVATPAAVGTSFDSTPPKSRETRQAQLPSGECEWVARWSAPHNSSPTRSGKSQRAALRGALWIGSKWVHDAHGGAQSDSLAGDASLTCVLDGQGHRLALDRDGDGIYNGDDCAPDDPLAIRRPSGGLRLHVAHGVGDGTRLTTEDVRAWFGRGVLYDFVAGSLDSLSSPGLDNAVLWTDRTTRNSVSLGTRSSAASSPRPGEGVFYLVAASNRCGTTGFGVGRESLDPWDATPWN